MSPEVREEHEMINTLTRKVLKQEQHMGGVMDGLMILAKSCNLIFESLLSNKKMDIDEVIRLNTFLKCLIKGSVPE